jgi:hypothetical protein
MMAFMNAARRNFWLVLHESRLLNGTLYERRSPKLMPE